MTFLPDVDPERSVARRALATAVSDSVGRGGRKALLIDEIDGEPAERSAFCSALVEVGFTATSKGCFKRAGAHNAPA